MASSQARAGAETRTRAGPFYAGMFLLCMAVLMLQIGQTRILSVISFYYLAFFAISMAMFGMAAGALLIHARRDHFVLAHLSDDLSRICVGFAWAITICLLMELTTTVALPGSLTLLVIWLKLIVLLFAPFFFAGMGVSLALTRSPFPIGIVYGTDLVGAAAGCLAMLAILHAVDGVTAMFIVSLIAAAAALCFAQSGVGAERPTERSAALRMITSPGFAIVAFSTLVAANVMAAPANFRIIFAKSAIYSPEDERWNSFSHIGIRASALQEPFVWGRSPVAPAASIEQRHLWIDAEAGTPMYRFDGDVRRLDFLAYDITTLAYRIRNQGRSAVIGVGGGRDLLSAHYFGFRDTTGVEINSIFIDWITGRYRDYAGIADLPGMKFAVDEARSWFARAGESFDLIQMSLIDTWAATGVGAFSLSENGLYTTTGWRRFLDRLTPNGVFTVSRWKSPGNIDESGRVFSLAMATLLEAGMADPSRHIFLAASSTLSTIIVGRAPLSASDVNILREACDRLRFDVLFSPGTPAATPALRQIAAAHDASDLRRIEGTGLMDLSPPDDERPFFFNQLKFGSPAEMLRTWHSADAGVIKGNLLATFCLLLIIALSGLLVIAVVLLPSAYSTRRSNMAMTMTGSAYFLLIGIGFMLIEIAFIQRMSVFIGHPVYSMAIVLFSIILSTGLGSLLSERFPLRTPMHLALWGWALAVYISVFPFWFSPLALRFEGGGIVLRAAICLLAIVPSGLLLGYGFPTGMRLVNAVDSRPTPWFWGVNGAAGVLAAGLAVALSIQWSIVANLWLGALCYALIVPFAVMLLRQARPV